MRRMRRLKSGTRFFVALSVIPILSSGCMLGPNYVRPQAQVAANWLEMSEPQLKADPADEAEWWKIFNDPVLNQLVETAYGQNLPLQQAGLRILQTRAQLGIAVGQFFPQVQDGTGSYTRSHISTNVAGLNDLSRLPFINLDRGSNNFQTGFDAAWELDFWGKFRRNIDSANAEVIASIASYDDVLVTLAAEVAATYIRLRTLEERLRLARENVKIQARSLQITDVRFRNGAVTELDVTQATSLLRNTQALMPELEAQIRQSQNALSVLLGMPPRTLNDILGGTRPIPAPPLGISFAV